jgi:hypothetical protein
MTNTANIAVYATPKANKKRRDGHSTIATAQLKAADTTQTKNRLLEGTSACLPPCGTAAHRQTCTGSCPGWQHYALEAPKKGAALEVNTQHQTKSTLKARRQGTALRLSQQSTNRSPKMPCHTWYSTVPTVTR